MKITKIKEPEVTREIRAVRDRMAGHVEEEGIYPFYAALNGRAAKLMALHRSPQRAAPPRDIKSRMAKRRALLDGVAEPRQFGKSAGFAMKCWRRRSASAVTSFGPRSTGRARSLPASTSSSMRNQRRRPMSSTTNSQGNAIEHNSLLPCQRAGGFGLISACYINRLWASRQVIPGSACMAETAST